MGNRCVITDKERTVSIYLHWNGGYGSVHAFLEYCRLKGYRGFGEDTNYGAARLVQVISNFFGGSSSIGVSTYTTDEGQDPGDNGIYVVKEWDVIEHFEMIYDKEKGKYTKSELPNDSEYDLYEMMESIDEHQPEKEKLGKDVVRSKPVDINTLKIGDDVLVYEGLYCKWYKLKVLGFFGEGPYKGKPYVDLIGARNKNIEISFLPPDYSPEKNYNNVLRDGKVRIKID